MYVYAHVSVCIHVCIYMSVCMCLYLCHCICWTINIFDFFLLNWLYKAFLRRVLRKSGHHHQSSSTSPSPSLSPSTSTSTSISMLRTHFPTCGVRQVWLISEKCFWIYGFHCQYNFGVWMAHIWVSIISQHWLRLFESVLVSWILEQIPVRFESKCDIFYSRKYFTLNEHSDSDWNIGMLGDFYQCHIWPLVWGPPEEEEHEQQWWIRITAFC